MSTGEHSSDPGPIRYPCPWCHLPAAWPDGCSELADAPGDVRYCASDIESHCMDGDHRRCAVGKCTVSIRWHDPIRAVGIAAARAFNRAWAVVSIIPNDVILAGTATDLEDAEQLWHTTLRNTGRDPEDPEGRGLVYIVRACDGAFL